MIPKSPAYETTDLLLNGRTDVTVCLTAEEKTELTVTGDAWEVTEYSAKLSGYANLPLEMGSAEFGIIYDKKQSFEEGKKILASVLDAQNMFTLTVSGLEAGTTYYYKSYVSE